MTTELPPEYECEDCGFRTYSSDCSDSCPRCGSGSIRVDDKAEEAHRLARIGSVLYGDHWKSAMARDLDVNKRTVRRWASEESAIPGHVWPTLTERLRVLQNSISDVLP